MTVIDLTQDYDETKMRVVYAKPYEGKSQEKKQHINEIISLAKQAIEKNPYAKVLTITGENARDVQIMLHAGISPENIIAVNNDEKCCKKIRSVLNHIACYNVTVINDTLENYVTSDNFDTNVRVVFADGCGWIFSGTGKCKNSPFNPTLVIKTLSHKLHDKPVSIYYTASVRTGKSYGEKYHGQRKSVIVQDFVMIAKQYFSNCDINYVLYGDCNNMTCVKIVPQECEVILHDYCEEHHAKYKSMRPVRKRKPVSQQTLSCKSIIGRRRKRRRITRDN